MCFSSFFFPLNGKQKHIHTVMRFISPLVLPWANASCTSPPTPARESWGGYMCACGDAAPTERTVDGLGREGEAWEEPAACAYKINSRCLLHIVGHIQLNWFHICLFYCNRKPVWQIKSQPVWFETDLFGAESHFYSSVTNKRSINLLPVAAPHPTRAAGNK